MARVVAVRKDRQAVVGKDLEVAGSNAGADRRRRPLASVPQGRNSDPARRRLRRLGPLGDRANPLADGGAPINVPLSRYGRPVWRGALPVSLFVPRLLFVCLARSQRSVLIKGSYESVRNQAHWLGSFQRCRFSWPSVTSSASIRTSSVCARFQT